jgi:hypothetical protein
VTITLTASTGAKIIVWRDREMFHSRRADTATEAQICMGIDLFEVIADLAGLDLEQGPGAAEALTLAEHAQRRLASADPDDDLRAPQLDGPPGSR